MFSFSKGDMILEFSFYWFTVRFRKIVSAKNALFLSEYASLRNKNVCLFLMHEKNCVECRMENGNASSNRGRGANHRKKD